MYLLNALTRLHCVLTIIKKYNPLTQQKDAHKEKGRAQPKQILLLFEDMIADMISNK